MDIPTRNIGIYVRKRGIKISKMARDTGIAYAALYDSLMNPERDRDLRAGEMLDVCKFLGVNAMDFAAEPNKGDE